MLSPAPPHFAVPGYELLGELGRGGMGVVYKARHRELKRMVALKMILAGVHASERERERFRAEAEAVAQLQHPNFVQVYAVGEHEGRPYLALEYVGGGNLAQRLNGMPAPPTYAARLVATLARAMHHAHEKGIVHRDLKPSNVLLQRLTDPNIEPGVGSGSALTDFFPKIADFGLAKQLDGTGSAMTEAFLGTPEYAAPEQIAANVGMVTCATDVFALGAILYEALTGKPPFRGENRLETLEMVCRQEPVAPSRLHPRVSRDLDTICLKCLQKQPHRRYASALALAADLESYLEGKAIAARPTGPVERWWKWARRRPTQAVLAAIAGLFALTLVVAIPWAYWREHDAKTHEMRLRNEAERALLRADQARRSAEQHLYESRVVQSQFLWQSANASEANRLLDQCPDPLRAWEWRYLDQRNRQTARRIQVFSEPDGWVNAVAFSPDGRLLATGGGGNPFARNKTQGHARRRPGAVKIWDVASGGLVHALGGPTNEITSVAFARDGARVHAGGWSLDANDDPIPEIFGWTLPDASPISMPPVAERGRFLGLAVLADGRCVAGVDHGVFTATHDDFTFTWEQESPLRLHLLDHAEPPWEFFGASSAIRSVALSPNGRLLAASDGVVRVWEMATGRMTYVLQGHGAGVNAVAWSPDGARLATASADRTVRLWDAKTGQLETTYRGHDDHVESLAFHPSGRILASGSRDGSVFLWDVTRVQDYVTVARQELTKYEDVVALHVDRESDVLTLARRGGQVQRRELFTGNLLAEWRIPLSQQWLVPARPVALSPDGGRLAGPSAEDINSVRVWTLARPEEPLVLAPHARPVWNLAWSPDGRWIATADGRFPRGNAREQPSEVRIWDAHTGKCLDLWNSGVVIHRLAFQPGSQRLFATFSFPKEESMGTIQTGLTAWEFDESGQRQGEPLQPLLLRAATARILALATSQRLVAVAEETGKITVLHAEAEIPLRLLGAEVGGYRQEALAMKDLGGVEDLAFHPHGTRLASLNRDHVKLWDHETGAELLTLQGARPRSEDPGFNPMLAWSPDGAALLASQWDNSVALFAGSVHSAGAANAGQVDRRAFAWHLERARPWGRPGSAGQFHWRQLQTLEPPTARLAASRAWLYILLGEEDRALQDPSPAPRQRP